MEHEKKEQLMQQAPVQQLDQDVETTRKRQREHENENIDGRRSDKEDLLQETMTLTDNQVELMKTET